MKSQSKKVELCVIKHAALENNRGYLLRTEITKSHLNNRICQQCGVKTSTVTPPPPVYYVFNISLSCNINMPSFIGNLWWDLILGNHLNLLIIKITISLLVIGLKKSYFPLIRLPSCYGTVCYWIVCYLTVCYRTVQ